MNETGHDGDGNGETNEHATGETFDLHGVTFSAASPAALGQ